MRRFVSVLAVMAIMAAMMVVMAMPAFAQEGGRDKDIDELIGLAGTQQDSGDWNTVLQSNIARQQAADQGVPRINRRAAEFAAIDTSGE